MSMALWIIVSFIISLCRLSQGIQCYSCTDSDYDGEAAETCFDVVSGSTLSRTCPLDAGSTIYYCRTIFTASDGVTTSVQRDCASSTSDEDINTISVPIENKCNVFTEPYYSRTSTAQCYYHCTTDYCNNVTTSSLKQCTSDCNRYNGGSCDYLTGNCVCTHGFTGNNCTEIKISPAFRKCVQCSSETDKECINSTKSVDCPGSENYCSTTTSTVFDPSFNIINNVLVRGCTTEFEFRADDECTFNELITDPPIGSLGYKEYNCYSTCDTDGCNTGTADGLLNGNEDRNLQCIVCKDTIGAGNCNPDHSSLKYRRSCPTGSTHCKTTVNYLLSEKADRRYEGEPSYQLMSVIRECSNSSVPTQCTESTVASFSFKKITCSETCQEDGCNIGWPARPKCITCSTGTSRYDYDRDGFDECLENPPVATSCPRPYQSHCFIEEQGIQKNNIRGIPRRITRGCSNYDRGNGCSSTMIRNITIENCNYTCTTDGCNIGGASPDSLQAVVAAIVFNP